MGVVGIGPRGRYVMESFLKQPEAQFVTVCDVQKANRRTAKIMVDRRNGNEDCGTTPDMHEVFGRDDIDAVLIATGDALDTLRLTLKASVAPQRTASAHASLVAAWNLVKAGKSAAASAMLESVVAADLPQHLRDAATAVLTK